MVHLKQGQKALFILTKNDEGKFYTAGAYFNVIDFGQNEFLPFDGLDKEVLLARKNNQVR